MEHGHETGCGVNGLKAAGSWSVFGSWKWNFTGLEFSSRNGNS
jgi:hypothetical protein